MLLPHSMKMFAMYECNSILLYFSKFSPWKLKLLSTYSSLMRYTNVHVCMYIVTRKVIVLSSFYLNKCDVHGHFQSHTCMSNILHYLRYNMEHFNRILIWWPILKWSETVRNMEHINMHYEKQKFQNERFVNFNSKSK